VDDTFWQQLPVSWKLQKNTFTCHAFDSDWPVWGVPRRATNRLFIVWPVTFILEQERDGAIENQESGAYVIVPRGIWHSQPGPSACFITPGEGTQHREAGK
jgi:hypothetical protein